MTKPARMKYSEQNARARFSQALDDALNAPRKPLRVTATLKRRALKKTLKKPQKKPGQPVLSRQSYSFCKATALVATIASGISPITGRFGYRDLECAVLRPGD
jgi:hypothetical protein